MKPFDLKAALHGKPVQTKNGHKILQVSVCWKAAPDSQVAAWTDSDMVLIYNQAGHLLGFEDSKLNLFMVSEIETPRTDKQSKKILYEDVGPITCKELKNWSILCRELETELEELKAERA